ncbi:MAG: hypothetical protein MRERV_41c015 [Mycoplasmataceae bacterium RV_VA103A]|nr:MAG: hypothetical protein MRERV_41c015 [Mycoplasmataceae bacterium RV_VA103A]
MGKKWDKTTCGGCKKLVSAEKLIPDFKNTCYLCDNCYEPRENINEPNQTLLIDEENDKNEGIDL